MPSWNASGPWSAQQVSDYLTKTRIPVRLACIDFNEVPRIVSLWFEWNEGALYCATQADAATARWLGARSCVGFEVASETPPYRGVRGSGVAVLDAARGRTQLLRLLDRYEIGEASSLRATLLRNQNSEVCIRIDPDRMDSWDYSARMVGVSS